MKTNFSLAEIMSTAIGLSLVIAVMAFIKYTVSHSDAGKYEKYVKRVEVGAYNRTNVIKELENIGLSEEFIKDYHAKERIIEIVGEQELKAKDQADDEVVSLFLCRTGAWPRSLLSPESPKKYASFKDLDEAVQQVRSDVLLVHGALPAGTEIQYNGSSNTLTIKIHSTLFDEKGVSNDFVTLTTYPLDWIQKYAPRLIPVERRHRANH